MPVALVERVTDRDVHHTCNGSPKMGPSSGCAAHLPRPEACPEGSNCSCITTRFVTYRN